MDNYYKRIFLNIFMLFILCGCSYDTNKINDFGSYYLQSFYNTSYRQVYNLQNVDVLKAKGNQKILVIPVEIKGEKKWSDEMLTNIDLAFFASSEEVGFESVSSYYYKSSYQQLAISGEVIQPLISQYTRDDLIDLGMNAPSLIANEFYEQADDDLLQKYDLDNNGHIDACAFIYSSPIDETLAPFWAWTSSFLSKTNIEKPTPCRHMWASYDFIYNGQYEDNLVDAHTYIHEFGHIIGLQDYYPYYGYYFPTGGLTMMDANILDLDPYSKMLMEWCYPYVVTQNCEITIKPFESSGECILITNDWNGSALDEYLLISFYTPTGLNYADSQSPYKGNNLQGFTKEGIMIYHIDSRLSKLKPIEKGYEFVEYVDNPDLTDGNLYVVGASNMVSSYQFGEYYDLPNYTDADLGRYKLIHLMEAGGSNTFQYGFYATNDTLFDVGDSFKANKYFFTYNEKFNNRSECPYQITIKEITQEHATISITK